MNIYVGADHRGFQAKESLQNWLESQGHTVTDCGNQTYAEDDDYVDFSVAVAQNVLKDPNSFGILMCGSGIGVAIAANRLRGIRAALCVNPEHATHARTNDHANVLCLAADLLDTTQVHEIVLAFLTAKPNLDPKYLRRTQKLDSIV